MARRGETIGAVDFGARDVRVLIAEKSHEGAMRILGHGVATSRGCVTQGVIQDLNAAQRALKQALAMAETEAGRTVPRLFCGMHGQNVEAHIREGRVAVAKDFVELGDMEEALSLAASNITQPGKKVVSSVSAQEWYLNDLRVMDPIGLRGTDLRTRVHFALLPSVIEDNISTVIESQGRDLEDVVYLPLASALGCLTPEDMELGVCVVDMGSTTCGLAVYRDRKIVATHTFAWGSALMTHDVAAGLQVTFEEALELICEYGISEEQMLRSQECDMNIFRLEATTGRPVRGDVERGAHIKLKSSVHGAPTIAERSLLETIIFERSRELITKVYEHLDAQHHLDHLVRGVVLVGGAARIKNMDALAATVFQAPARFGVPDGVDVLPTNVNSPEWVAAAGILRHGFQYRDALRSGRIEPHRGFFGRALHSTRRTLRKYFV